MIITVGRRYSRGKQIIRRISSNAINSHRQPTPNNNRTTNAYVHSFKIRITCCRIAKG